MRWFVLRLFADLPFSPDHLAKAIIVIHAETFIASGHFFVACRQSATVPTNPGFNPGTGQINPGPTEQAPSQSAQIIKIPTPEEARAAFIMPGWKEPSLGQALTAPSQGPNNYS
jgi:hypothetical protein